MRHTPNDTYRACVAVPPGDILRDELKERGWSQANLARQMNRPLKTINEIIKAKTGITPETALQLEAVLGVSAEMWCGLEWRYRLNLARGLPNINHG